MATWTDIPTARIEPGKPGRSIDAIALRDNPIAIAEGALGAPKTQTAGIADQAVTNQKIQSVAWGKVTNRPAVGVGYSTGVYVLSIPTGGIYDVPSGYVVVGLSGTGYSGGAGISPVLTLRARALQVIL